VLGPWRGMLTMAVVLGAQAFLFGDGGIRALEDELVDVYGLDLTGWSLLNVYDITSDGTTMTGLGVGPGGTSQAFVAVIPEPATLTLLALGALIPLRRRRG
ncbi:hypothetical protein LCGC14_3162420, partial [marine sediment metagenome]